MNNLYVKCLGLFIGWLCLSVAAVAQNPPAPAQPPFRCDVPELTPTQRKILESEAAAALQRKKASGVRTGITYVPIRPHILRASDGTGGLTLTRLNYLLARTNRYFLLNGTGMQFYFCGTVPDYIDNDTWHTSYDRDIHEGSVADPRDVTNAMNMYFYWGSTNWDFNGYAYYPGDYPISTRSFIQTAEYSSVSSEDGYRGSQLIPHELGHNFNLIHTHGEVVGQSAELVTRGVGANCTTEADLLCDTPADPYGHPYGIIPVDANGDTYTPPVHNLMSYYAHRFEFTPEQYARMEAALALRQSHTTYSLTCAPTVVNAPTNLAASGTTGSVLLTWTDNADNEMGYFIERSTSPTDGFRPINGVAPNATAFADTSYFPNVRMYYRIRPSNSTTEGISSPVRVVSHVPPPCTPIFADCYNGYALTSFTFNNTVLSENTGCASSVTNLYYTVVPNVTPGQTYTIAGTFSGTDPLQAVRIWIDANRNGQFTDAGEQVFQTPGYVAGSFSGTLTIPASTTAGPLRMRVLNSEFVMLNDACGSYFARGEAEDYMLNVVPESCTAMSTVRNGDWSNPMVWSCNRLPSVTDAVRVSHSITLPAGTTGNALYVQYANEGQIVLQNGAKVRLSP